MDWSLILELNSSLEFEKFNTIDMSYKLSQKPKWKDYDSLRVYIGITINTDDSTLKGSFN